MTLSVLMAIPKVLPYYDWSFQLNSQEACTEFSIVSSSSSRLEEPGRVIEEPTKLKFLS